MFIWQFLVYLVNRNWPRMGPTFKLFRPIKRNNSEGALKDHLEGFWGYWRPFKGPRAQLAVAPDGNVVLFVAF